MTLTEMAVVAGSTVLYAATVWVLCRITKRRGVVRHPDRPGRLL